MELDAHGKLLFRLNLTSITSWEVAQLNEVVGVSMSWYVVEQAQYTEEVLTPHTINNCFLIESPTCFIQYISSTCVQSLFIYDPVDIGHF